MKNNQQKLSGSVLAFFAANLVTLFFAYLLKAPCLTLPWDLSQYSNFCYNDLQPLYGSRHLDRHSIP
ncbi:MAG: hypothetical protein ACREXX_23800, partial [Gammaproteobacteria bacterium]